MLTILQGSTFCIGNDDGTIGLGPTGFFADDTRFLSRFELRLDGREPLLLSSGRVEYFNAAHYLRNAATDRLPRDTISISRERFIGRGLAERLIVRNEGSEKTSFTLEIALEADFVDIITLKAREFAIEAGEEIAPPAPAQTPRARTAREWALDDPDSELLSWVVASRELELRDGLLGVDLELGASEQWDLVLEVIPGHNHQERGTSETVLHFGGEARLVQKSLAAWGLVIPRLEAVDRRLEDAYYRSISDLASLRLRNFGAVGELPAAGMPWFMTLFGRDTLITSLQTLLFGSDLASGALRSLAALQATGDHPDVDAEPGKIPHEVRRGKAAAAWFPIYYGSLDSTPLFLILLSEVWRWSGDATLVDELWEHALAALDWIDTFGDRDGDGFLEYERRTERGLENQSWKDSGDSQRFRDGSLARTPIAPVEVQGYAFDAKRRMGELARVVRHDARLAERLDLEAQALGERFDEAFWMDDREAYALALDGDKRQVDTICSNIGHLLWSGIVPEHRRESVAEHLMSRRMWSGWGVRTMAADEIPYNPISYHNGTVWPHDTSLIAWGLEEAQMPAACHRVCRGVLDAAGSFSDSLPEVFAGFDRSETPFAVAYPTASRPQAWAAGAPILCLQLLLGLRPDPAADVLTSVADEAPAWLGDLSLTGVRARGRHWTVTVDDRAVGVEEMA